MLKNRFVVQPLVGSLRRQRESIEEPAELLRGDVYDLGHPLGPAESMLLQTLVPEAEAVAIPVQHLDGVAPAVAEDEEVPGERVQIKDALDRHAQPVDACPHVRGAGSEIDLGRGYPQHRGSSTDSSRVSIASSKSAGISRA